MEKKRQFFQKQHSILQRALSYMLVLAMVLTMGTFSQLGGVTAKAADEAVTETRLTVHFKNTENWDGVHLYSWETAGLEDYNKWNEKKAIDADTENEGWYSLTALVTTGDANIIFSYGEEQTTDIKLELKEANEEYWISCPPEKAGNKLNADAEGAVSKAAPEGWKPSTIVVKLHYHRPDGNYENWDAWMWEDGKDGQACAFKEVDGEMVATFGLAEEAGKVGFIVRRKEGDNAWAEKDIEDNRFVEIADVFSGVVHVYAESGQADFKVNKSGAVQATRVQSVVYDGDHTISVKMTGAIDADDLATVFTVSGKSGEIAIDKVTAGENHVYSILLSESLIRYKSYTLNFGGKEISIQMPIYYSNDDFEKDYTYTGDDLGATYTKIATQFRVWAPEADAVAVNLYKSGTAGTDDKIESLPMTADKNGTWVALKSGDLNGTYYTYTVTRDGKETEACDPYARTTGVNGKRAMVIDLDATDPEGWAADANPYKGNGITDAVIYEGHIRDLTVDEDSGVKNKGKYLGLTEAASTAVQHMKELGITHLHLLPVYDFGSVDETKEDTQYNWGYDPVNYNVPEGSYSTNAADGAVRVKEFKQMVQSLHNNGISVVMDVVYNHVQDAGTFCVNQIVPGYFSRISDDGTYSNGSGCGNDTASERSMVRKYIVDSVCYWADEYHINGFRFDLVGLLDTQTINEIVTEVHKTHPDVIFYGEGWTMTTSVTKPDVTMATQENSELTPGFSYFNDAIRDDLKGSVFDKGTGYVSGTQDKEEAIEKDFLGASKWCKNPSQSVNYASCHDNNTLYDRIKLSRPDASEEDLVRMNTLSAAIYMLAEGTPFMQAGEDFLRSKVNSDGTFNENSYNSGDGVNAIRWGNLENSKYADVFNYYKGLIAFRKAHGALRLSSAADVAKTVTAVDGLAANVVAFDIKGGINGETAEEMFVIFNANPKAANVTLPAGNWDVYVNDQLAGTTVLGTISGTAAVAPISAMVLVRKPAEAEPEPSVPAEPEIGTKPVETVVDDIESSAQSSTASGKKETVTVDMKKADGTYETEVPKEVLTAAKGSNVDVVFDMGGYQWTINGKDIKDAKDVNLEVKMNTNAVPKNIVSKLAGKNDTVQLSLSHDGEFGFKAALKIALDKKYAGKFGNLYYYNKGKLEPVQAGKIDKNGNVTFTFEHASDYVIVIDEKNQINTAPPTSDHSPIIPFAVLLIAAIGMVVFAAVRRRKTR